MNNTREFPCTLDRMAKIITVLSFIGLPLLLLYIGKNSDDFRSPVFRILIGIGLGAQVIIAAFSPRAVGADKEGIWIRRWIGSKKIPHNKIMDVRLPEENEMRGAIRTFGNGGLFGYTGYYRNAKVGSMLWFCTCRSNYVLVVRASGPVVVITPDDSEGFVAHYRKATAA